MTLYRQLVLVVLTLFLLMFTGTLLVNFHTTRSFLMEQLMSHAQDTATSLGVSVTPLIRTNDMPTMKSLVDAVFDRGYYQDITVDTLEGKVLVQRKAEIAIAGVPDWFVNLVKLQAPQANASWMSGWSQAGTVSVQSHTGYAYEQLWHTTTQMIFWFLGTALFGILAGGLILRYVLRPLQAMERQAEAVSALRYEVQEKLPKTRELRSVVLAMNRMTQKIKTSFEEQVQSAEHLRLLAYRDPVTGVGNRRYFEAQLQTHLKLEGELHRGALLLIQLNDLNGINNRHGYQAGDTLLKQAVVILEQAITDYGQCVLARLAGADFGLLVPDISVENSEILAAIICEDLAGLHGQGFSDSANVAHIGIALYTSEANTAELLSEADMALRAAQAHGINGWYRYSALPQLPEIHGRHDWKTYITDVISADKVVLHVQPVVDARDSQRILQREVLVRIPGENITLLPAGMFMPMAERLDVALEIDKAVITMVIAHLSKQPAATPLAVNLSIASLHTPEFADWLFGMLARLPGKTQKIAFEFSEFLAVRELDRLRDFTARIRKTGHGFGLDQFGRGFSKFGYLESLRPDYVKIDGSYTNQVTQDHDNQFFLRTLGNIAHSLDITVIPQSVETEAQWQKLKELNVDGVQGYAVGRPHPID